MTAKEAVRRIVEDLTEEEAQELLDFLNLRAEPDTLTEEEMAEVEAADQEFARGEYITREEFLKKYPI